MKFEMELTQYESADFVYIVRFKKIGSGSNNENIYRDICTKILNSMNL